VVAKTDQDISESITVDVNECKGFSVYRRIDRKCKRSIITGLPSCRRPQMDRLGHRTISSTFTKQQVGMRIAIDVDNEQAWLAVSIRLARKRWLKRRSSDPASAVAPNSPALLRSGRIAVVPEDVRSTGTIQVGKDDRIVRATAP